MEMLLDLTEFAKCSIVNENHVIEDEIHFLLCCPLYNEARTEAGLQHVVPNAASFV
jgi:hypothetical protein